MMRFIWLNRLLRHIYRHLPLPWHIKQRAKAIYLGLPVPWKVRSRKALLIGGNREPLPLLAALARRFDPADPWALVFGSELTGSDPVSGFVRITMILRVLTEMGFRITFVPGPDRCSEDYEQLLGKGSICVLRGSSAIRRHLTAEGSKYHLVLLSGRAVTFEYLPYIRAYALYSRVVYYSPHWIERETGIPRDSAASGLDESSQRIELFNVASADLILVPTDEEKNRLLLAQPDARVNVLSEPYEITPPGMPFAQRSGLLFMGDFRYKPDEDAAIYFANDILPRIIEKVAGLVFFIAGSNMPASVKALRSCYVEPLGLIPDAASYFESCRMFVAPLRFGTTTRNMIGQSLAHGLPVVATSLGTQGIDVENEKHLLIANDADEFANAVVRLYNDEILWQRLSTVALDHMQDRYSYTAARKRMYDIFRSMPDADPAARNVQDDGTSPSSGPVNPEDPPKSALPPISRSPAT